jgi:hypothetical protein
MKIHQFSVPIFENIPHELRKIQRWVNWKAEGPAGEKPRKVPYAPGTIGRRASATDPTTWGTCDQAFDAYETGYLLDDSLSGIGIVLNGDGLVGVDIDHCVFDGKPSEESMALLDSLGAGYIEISPSGTGLRALGYGEQLSAGVNGSRGGLKAEFYSTGRYLTITGSTIRSGPLVPLKDFKATAESFRLAKKTKVKHATGEIVQTPADERYSVLVKSILSGEVYHDCLRDLAASMVANGMNASAVTNHLRGLMDASEAPHDDRWKARKAEIKDLVASAAKFRPTTAAEDFSEPLNSEHIDFKQSAATEEAAIKARQPHYRMLTAIDLSQLPPLRWRIRDVLPETGLSMLLGESTAGKTFVALDIAAHVSLGLPWHGIKTYKAPVVYVGLEGERGIQRRIHAWEKHYRQALPDNLRFVLQPFNMLQITNLADMVSAVLDAGGKGGIIIVDTLNRATPGADENSSVDMGNTIAAAKELQSATSGMVMLVHHKGKRDSAGARGHSSLYGALDAAIAVNNKGGQRSWSTAPLKGGKTKDGEAITKNFELKRVSLGVDEELLSINSAVVMPCDYEVRQVKSLTANQKFAMAAFSSAAKVNGTLDSAGNLAGLHVETWRVEFYKNSTADNTNAKKTAFGRARKELVELGQVSVLNDIYRLKNVELFDESDFADAVLAKEELA